MLGYNNLQNIWDKLYFPCETGHYGKAGISIYLKIFASTDKIGILGGGLSTRQ